MTKLGFSIKQRPAFLGSTNATSCPCTSSLANLTGKLVAAPDRACSLRGRSVGGYYCCAWPSMCAGGPPDDAGGAISNGIRTASASNTTVTTQHTYRIHDSLIMSTAACPRFRRTLPPTPQLLSAVPRKYYCQRRIAYVQVRNSIVKRIH